MSIWVFVIGAGVGLLLFLTAYYQRRQLEASQSWPSATGTITFNSIEESVDQNNSDGAYTASYTPKVAYRYLVNGRPFNGQRIGFSTIAYSRYDRAMTELAPYPVDAQVPVFYDPQKPGNSVLVRAAKGSSVILWIGAGILMLVFGAALKQLFGAR